MKLESPITELKGIGEKSAKLFAKLNIETVGDLLHHFPKDYVRFEETESVLQIQSHTPSIGAVYGTVTATPVLRRIRSLTILTVMVKDEAATPMKLSFFNMPYLKNVFSVGSKHVFYGTVYVKGTFLCMDHPKVYKPEEYGSLLGVLQPIYPLTKGISNGSLRKYIAQALSQVEPVEEFLPAKVVAEHQFGDYLSTLRLIHNPTNTALMTQARKRLAYEEFFFFVMAMKYKKYLEQEEENGITFLETADTTQLIEKLPYELTSSQQNAWQEIKQDLTGGKAANRLIQGDVGSGKTILALLSLLMCCANGYQGAMMAPTEVLAMQHFDTITEMTGQYDLPFRPVLLVGSLTAKGKREAYEGIANGFYNLIIGTHALIQDKLSYHDLALVVMDEQHRFGVKQRENLSSKGNKGRIHTLVMSATPIPRSLAIILYGDLSVSTIPELPKNRLPIKNCVVGKGYRETAYSFIQKEVEQGHQAYIICPMVESGVMDELENVIEYSEQLKQRLDDKISIAYLHGKMKPAAKNQIMLDFAERRIDVLVSTTVIEVGINVPNATVMMVENADRFGLAALHQIRGRVGRGSAQSYCIFVDTKESNASKERLSILNKSNDGFFIANEDLRLRGPGDLTGTMQSGEFQFHYADIYADSEMLIAASKDVDELMQIDPLLNEESHILCKKRCQKYFEEEYINVI